MRFFAWLALSILATTAIGCGSDDKKTGLVDDIDAGGGGSSGSGGSKADSSTDAPLDSKEDSKLDVSTDVSDSAVEASEASVDATPDVAKDVVIEYNIQPCPVASRALGSKAFKANSASSDAFVAAYNAELASMTYPGPMLMVFNGLDSTDSAKWKLQVGPLMTADGSTKVSFASTPVEMSFSLGEGFTINFPDTPTKNFALRFATLTTTADLPIASIAVSGVFDGTCSALQVETVYMYVPVTAASLPFHGSTVGALMGTPDQNIDGGKANAWLLSLSGEAQPVELQ